MKQEFTTAELCAAVEALQGLFDAVALLDPHAGLQLDPATQKPLCPCAPVPALDAKGRGVRRLPTGMLTVYQAIALEGRPLVLAFGVEMPHTATDDLREANARDRAMSQWIEDLSHDFVTGAYNRRYLDEVCAPRAARCAACGSPVCVTMARVNQYFAICRTESTEAVDTCLSTAAGILRLAVGPDEQRAALVRLEDGLFAAVAFDRCAADLEAALREKLETARRSFSLSLSRRGEFTVSLASADWGETGGWDMMLALAQQRLAEL